MFDTTFPVFFMLSTCSALQLSMLKLLTLLTCVPSFLCSAAQRMAAPASAGVDRINRERNKTLLVVGHSNTILELARGLGATPTLTKINGTDFDNLFRIRIRKTPFRRSVQLRETTYGQSTQ